jgi:hypothetical protein
MNILSKIPYLSEKICQFFGEIPLMEKMSPHFQINFSFGTDFLPINFYSLDSFYTNNSPINAKSYLPKVGEKKILERGMDGWMDGLGGG